MSTATRGFGSMATERQRIEAAKGGKKTQSLGKGHLWNSETARAAAIASHQKRRKRQHSEDVQRRWQEIMAHASAHLSEDERAELATLNAELFALIS